MRAHSKHIVFLLHFVAGLYHLSVPTDSDFKQQKSPGVWCEALGNITKKSTCSGGG